MASEPHHMVSDIALHFSQKIPKKDLNLILDNLLQSGYLDFNNVTNGNVANGGINAKFSNEVRNDEFLNPLSTIKKLWLSNVNRVLIGNLNIISLPKKFSQLKEIVLKREDILVLTETKEDDFFSKFIVFS